MPSITVLKARRFEKTFDFDKDVVFMGREEGNDLVLADGSVSRVHAKLVRDSGGYSVLDLNSTNGVYVNNARVREMPVKDGDVIIVGDFTLFVRLHDQATPPAPPPSADQVKASYQSLRNLCALSAKLKQKSSIQECLEAMTDCLLEIFSAERGFILIHDRKSGALEPTVIRRKDAADARVQISRTLAARVLEELRPVVITDVEADEKVKNIESVERDQIRSIICAPLGREKPLGVVYLDSRIKSRAFDEDDLNAFDTFLEHASTLLETTDQNARLREDNARLNTLARDVSLADHDTERIVGVSPRLKAVLAQVPDIAREDVTVLVTGQSGTGKELIAKALHYSSRRAQRPFVAVNCMALSEDIIESELFGHEKGAFTGAVARKIGKFEMAFGGTVFLDEVGELSARVQVKLLRVLQERVIQRVGGNEDVELDIRVVSATNRDLKKAIAAGTFREDLFYRLNVFTIELPALAERKEDVPSLVSHYIEMFNRKMGKAIQGIDPDALGHLVTYDWPGNIRELRNVIERAFVVEKTRLLTASSLPFNLLADTPTQGDDDALPTGFEFPTDFEKAKELFEKNFIIQSLRRHKGNITAASKETNLPRRTMYRRLEKYGIDPKTVITETMTDEDLQGEG